MKLSLRLFPTAFGALALLLASPVIKAQTIVDDFSSVDDSAWIHVSPTEDATYTVSGGTYHIQAPAPESGTAGAGTVRIDASFTDFKVTVDLVAWDDRAETHQAIGIVARVGEGTGYFFHYDPHGSAGNAGIWIDGIEDESVFAIENGFTQFGTPLNSDEAYRLEFTGTGGSLSGRVYLLSDISTSLYEVDVTDSTYTSGFAGLLVADQGVLDSGNQSADATFDNFSATAIPEPGTSGLIAALACGAIALYFRRHRALPISAPPARV